MNGHGIVKISFASPHPNGNRETLHHFVSAITNYVTTHDALVCTDSN